MSTSVAANGRHHAGVESVESTLIQGNLADMAPESRLKYYMAVCESLGLNHLTRPFEYISLNGKLTLYATRACTDQLRTIRRVSIVIANRHTEDGVYIVTARATTPDGRTDESTGAVFLGSLKGEALANAYMKAETKAKRRVTLSICGLGWLDETEVETIPNAIPGEPKPQLSPPAAAAKVLADAGLPVQFGTDIKPPQPPAALPAPVYVSPEELVQIELYLDSEWCGLEAMMAAQKIETAAKIPAKWAGQLLRKCKAITEIESIAMDKCMVLEDVLETAGKPALLKLSDQELSALRESLLAAPAKQIPL